MTKPLSLIALAGLGIGLMLGVSGCAQTKLSFAEAATQVMDLQIAGYDIESCVIATLSDKEANGEITEESSKEDQNTAYEDSVISCVETATTDEGKDIDSFNKKWASKTNTE